MTHTTIDALGTLSDTAGVRTLTLHRGGAALPLDADAARALAALQAASPGHAWILTHLPGAPPVPAPPEAEPATRFAVRMAWHRALRGFEAGGRPVAIVTDAPVHDAWAEIALAAHAVFATPGTPVGWPGLLRGRWAGLGASARLPRRMGLQPALAALFASAPDAAGLLTAVHPDRAAALDAAAAWCAAHPEVADPHPSKGARIPGVRPGSVAAQQVLLGAQAQLATHLPAGHVAEQVLVALSDGLALPLDRALEVEARVWTAAAR